MTDDLPGPGDLVDGVYRLASTRAGVGWGEAWAATSESQDERALVKVLRPDPLVPDWFTRFESYVPSTTSLRHPNAVSMVARGRFGDSGGFVVYREPEGDSLRQWLARHQMENRPPDLAIVRELFDQIAQALSAAHRLNVPGGSAHGGVVPECVFVEKRGEKRYVVTVADFGLPTLGFPPSSWVGPPEGQPWGITPTPALDTFALGRLLAEMITLDTPPVERSNAMRDRLRAARPEAHGSLWDLVFECMDPEPSTRVPHAMQLRDRARRCNWSPQEVRQMTLPPAPKNLPPPPPEPVRHQSVIAVAHTPAPKLVIKPAPVVAPVVAPVIAPALSSPPAGPPVIAPAPSVVAPAPPVVAPAPPAIASLPAVTPPAITPPAITPPAITPPAITPPVPALASPLGAPAVPALASPLGALASPLGAPPMPARVSPPVLAPPVVPAVAAPAVAATKPAARPLFVLRAGPAKPAPAAVPPPVPPPVPEVAPPAHPVHAWLNERTDPSVELPVASVVGAPGDDTRDVVLSSASAVPVREGDTAPHGDLASLVPEGTRSIELANIPPSDDVAPERTSSVRLPELGPAPVLPSMERDIAPTWTGAPVFVAGAVDSDVAPTWISGPPSEGFGASPSAIAPEHAAPFVPPPVPPMVVVPVVAGRPSLVPVEPPRWPAQAPEAWMPPTPAAPDPRDELRFWVTVFLVFLVTLLAMLGAALMLRG